jgi:hypothetical protein
VAVGEEVVIDVYWSDAIFFDIDSFFSLMKKVTKNHCLKIRTRATIQTLFRSSEPLAFQAQLADCCTVLFVVFSLLI